MVKNKQKTNNSFVDNKNPVTTTVIKMSPKKFLTIPCLLFLTITPIIQVKAATLDDLRELLGDERLESKYTEKQREEIIEKYKSIEDNNRLYSLYEPEIVEESNKKVLEEKAKIEKLITQKEQELTEAFNSTKTPEEIISIRSSLSNLEFQKNSIRDTHDIMDIKYIENTVEEEYKNVLSVIDELETYQDLGEIGSHLASPLIDSFVITSPFGYRVHPITGEFDMHNGIDISGEVGKPVYAQWNGVVSRVYETTTGGLSIEIDHGNNTLTRYLHLKRQMVQVGQPVDQYTQIGEVGMTGATTGPHLHFEVLIDGEHVNPIYFYGKLGAKMLNNYIMESNDPYHQSMKDIIYEIKDDPEWLKKYREENKPSYEPGEREVEKVYQSSPKSQDSSEVKLQEGYKFSKPSTIIR